MGVKKKKTMCVIKCLGKRIRVMYGFRSLAPTASIQNRLVFTWMEAEVTIPVWSKSKETTWEKRLALPFMQVEAFPKASRTV